MSFKPSQPGSLRRTSYFSLQMITHL